jgi:hypothetical protein
MSDPWWERVGWSLLALLTMQAGFSQGLYAGRLHGFCEARGLVEHEGRCYADGGPAVVDTGGAP